MLYWDSGWRVKWVLVSELESDGLEVSLGSRLEIGMGSELSLRVEMAVGDKSWESVCRADALRPCFSPTTLNLCPFSFTCS